MTDIFVLMWQIKFNTNINLCTTNFSRLFRIDTSAAGAGIPDILYKQQFI